LLKPTDNIYIAFDGVAPVAKLQQQRNRRYKSRFEKKINDKRFLQYIFIDYSDVQNTMETSVCSLETTQFNN
jgi:5'-3' exonuclease